MAQSKCVSCGAAQFEMKDITPVGSNFKMIAAQCASCGGVVSIMERLNAGKLLLDIQRKLGMR